MNCDLCNKKATVFLTQIVGSKMQKVNLCESCSGDQGVTDPAGFALADLLTGIGSEKQLRRPSAPDDAVCPECGFSQSDFKKTGRLGCPSCYRVFRDSLENLLGTMHRGTAHVGKVPSTYSAAEESQTALADLQQKLEQAVARENYEEAAKLRDEIQRLEQTARSDP